MYQFDIQDHTKAYNLPLKQVTGFSEASRKLLDIIFKVPDFKFSIQQVGLNHWSACCNLQDQGLIAVTQFLKAKGLSELLDSCIVFYLIW